MKRMDLTGQKFGHLTVLYRTEDHITSGGNKLVAYECECSCGRRKTVLSSSLRLGRTTTCGQCGVFYDYSSIIGKRFGYLTVIDEIEPRIDSKGNKTRMYNCQCDCGNFTKVSLGHLRSGHTRSCGKCDVFDCKIDLTGKRFGKLVAIECDGYYEYPNGDKDYKWRCLCDCGNYVTIRHNSLVDPNFNHNCGCYRKELRISDEDMVGKRFGKLVVTSRAEHSYSITGTVVHMWNCLCDCGKEIVAKGVLLRRGDKLSCGCMHPQSKSEFIVSNYLSDLNVNFEEWVVFDDLYGLGGGNLSYDFGVKIQDKLLLIELNGAQHYRPIGFFGGEESFSKQCAHDELKRNYAKEHDYPLLVVDCSVYNESKIISEVDSFIKSYLT